MNSPDKITVRKYLLGFLPEDESNAIEEKLFSEESFLALIEQVEDEIIDEYLEDSLSAADKQAVEDHFMEPAERREKLRFAGTLRSHIQQKKKQNLSFERGWHAIKPVYFYAVSAIAVALFAVSIGLVMNNLRLQRKLDSETAREQTMQAALNQQLREAQLQNEQLQNEQHRRILHVSGHRPEKQGEPVYLVVNLKPIQPRGIESATRLKLDAKTRGLEVRLPLVDAPFHSYQAVLRSANGKELAAVAKVTPANAGELSFRIPYPKLEAGNYVLVLVGGDSSGKPLATSSKTYYITLEK
jgi:anti-sigma-K factor RskA